MNGRNLLHSVGYQINSTESLHCEKEYEFGGKVGGIHEQPWQRSSMIKQEMHQAYLAFKSEYETAAVCTKMNEKILGHPQSAANTLLVGHLLEIVKNLILDKSKPRHVETFCLGYSMGGRNIWLIILFLYNHLMMI